MFYTLRPTLAVALLLWGVTSVVVLAAVTTISGTIQDVDTTTGRLTLRSPEGTVTALSVPVALLASLQAGDMVEVKRSGPNAIIIRKQAGVPPSARDDARPRP